MIIEFKIFEAYQDYQHGDFVLTHPSEWFFRTARIVDRKDNKYQQALEYKILTNYLASMKPWIGWINSTEIDRKISLEEYKEIRANEIEEYEMKKSTDKYNL